MVGLAAWASLSFEYNVMEMGRFEEFERIFKDHNHW
jgi:hypothetical protein